MRLHIKYADVCDLEYLIQYDKHIGKEIMEKKINIKEIFTIHLENELIGCLRYGYFWDNIPFMNMLFIDERYRNKGYASKLVRHWKKTMKEIGYTVVMTSTLSNEQAQFFYRKQGMITIL